MNILEQVITTGEAAKLLSKEPSTIKKAIYRGIEDKKLTLFKDYRLTDRSYILTLEGLKKLYPNFNEEDFIRYIKREV